jgi:hypothetical protein
MAGEDEAVVGDGDVEVLGHMAALERNGDAAGDRRGAAQRSFGARDCRGDGSQIAFAGLQQILALTRPRGGQIGIAADDQPFAGVIWRGDAALSGSSNSDSCSAPPSTRPRICGARRAVIQSSRAGRSSRSMGAWVIMPRSPRVKPVA